MATCTAVEVYEWIDKELHPTFYWICDYLSILGGVKLTHITKRASGVFIAAIDLVTIAKMAACTLQESPFTALTAGIYLPLRLCKGPSLTFENMTRWMIKSMK